MQDSELEITMKRFLDQKRSQYGNDSFAAGYLSSWMVQLGTGDRKLGERIIRQLNYTMNVYSEKV